MSSESVEDPRIQELNEIIDKHLEELEPGKAGVMTSMLDHYKESILTVLEKDTPYRAIFFSVLSEFSNTDSLYLTDGEKKWIENKKERS